VDNEGGTGAHLRRGDQAGKGRKKSASTAGETRKTGSQKVNICRNETAIVFGMNDDIRDKYLKTLDRVKGIEPSYSAWKPRPYPSRML
jgi:hypothetical protein